MSKTILLADDSVTIRKVVELTFMEEDFDLLTATNGSEALSMLEERMPDLVIADVHMPEVGGLDVCREVKSRNSRVPVLLLVGAFEPFDPEDAETCGADQFLKKPFDSQDLLRQVNKLVAGTDQEEPGAPATPDEEPEAGEAVAAAVEEGDPAAAVIGAEAGGGSPSADLSAGAVDRIARRVVELLSADAVREVAWEVVPDLAETVIKERLNELEQQVD